MISRRDNLLIRPWQQRKFEHHRRKVQSALPAIDSTPPPFRQHVAIKLKKQQKEYERNKKIERENFILLEKMNYIMKTSRVDNMWKTPPPNFLNRVGIYHSGVDLIDDFDFLDFDENFDEISKPRSRKSKCCACSPPKLNEKEKKVYEQRIPWEPEKKPVSRLRSKSVPVRKPVPLPCITEQSSDGTEKPSSSKKSTRVKSSSDVKTPKIKNELYLKPPKSIVLSRGCLKLSVNFPSDTLVKYQEGHSEKLLQRGLCHCRNSPNEIIQI